MTAYRNRKVHMGAFIGVVVLSGMIISRVWEGVPPGQSLGLVLTGLPPLTFSLAWALLGTWLGNSWWRRIFFAGGAMTLLWGGGTTFMWAGSPENMLTVLTSREPWFPVVLVLMAATLGILFWVAREPAPDMMQGVAGFVLVFIVPYCAVGAGMIPVGLFLPEAGGYFCASPPTWAGFARLLISFNTLHALIVFTCSGILILAALMGMIRGISHPHPELEPGDSGELMPEAGSHDFSILMLCWGILGGYSTLVFVLPMAGATQRTVLSLANDLGVPTVFPCEWIPLLYAAPVLWLIMVAWSLIMPRIPWLSHSAALAVMVVSGGFFGWSWIFWPIGESSTWILLFMGLMSFLRSGYRLVKLKETSWRPLGVSFWPQVWDMIGMGFFAAVLLFLVAGLGQMHSFMGNGLLIVPLIPSTAPGSLFPVVPATFVDVSLGVYWLLTWAIPWVFLLIAASTPLSLNVLAQQMMPLSAHAPVTGGSDSRGDLPAQDVAENDEPSGGP